MISDKTYQQLINTCDFRRQKESDECESLYTYAMDQEFGNIDQYNIYAAPCNNSDGSAAATRHLMRLPHRPHNYKVHARARAHTFLIHSYLYIVIVMRYNLIIPSHHT